LRRGVIPGNWASRLRLDKEQQNLPVHPPAKHPLSHPLLRKKKKKSRAANLSKEKREVKGV